MKGCRRKIPRISTKRARDCAVKDIAEECKRGFFTKNYLWYENLILKGAGIDFEYLPIC